MNFRHVQAPTAAVMVRPHRFTVNPETLSDNAFQSLPEDPAAAVVSLAAMAEFDEGPTTIGVPAFRTFFGAALLAVGDDRALAVLRRAASDAVDTGDAGSCRIHVRQLW